MHHFAHQRLSIFLIIVIVVLLILTGCGGGGSPQERPNQVAVTGEPTIDWTGTPIPTVFIPTVADPVEPTPTTMPTEIPVTVEPEEVVIIAPESGDGFTPEQAEEENYPQEKPDDRDSDLTQISGRDAMAAGEVLDLSGKIYDQDGQPLENILIEIWHADENGLFSQEPGYDLNFQGYGETRSTADGSYRFRTIRPGPIGREPATIYVKLNLDDSVLLTTALFFEGQTGLNSDNLNQLIELSTLAAVDGNSILIGRRDLVVNLR